MASRRMFTKQIIDSDAFLDMPLSSQTLYFHLSMRADDDGFINNPRKVQRMIGASDDDLKLLIGKRFVIAFENGVIVIKHWRMHNAIRKDRYTPTQYQEELKRLTVKENGSYTENGNHLATTWQPLGNQPLPQGRLGKDRLGKDREEIVADAPSLDFESIVSLYRQHCQNLQPVRALNDKRKKTLKAWGDINEMEQTFIKAGQSGFLGGENDRGWKANFDWVIKPENRIKILEGNYQNKSKKVDVTSFNNYDQRDYNYNSLERQMLGLEEE